jgi:DNA invertase Pin-like site-specific DNA recombinase
MADGKFVVYLRVSTPRQGQSGLGLEAQREAVRVFLNGGTHETVEEFVEVETGKGSNALKKRPKLKAALDACKANKATLLIAKLDRLARNVHFVSGLMESDVDFVAVDFPQANRLTIHILAAVAEHEREMISQRTKAALAAAKARGVVLGAAGPANLRPNVEARQRAALEFAERVRPLFDGMKARKVSQRQMADELNVAGVRTQHGKQWSQTQVNRVLARLG